MTDIVMNKTALERVLINLVANVILFNGIKNALIDIGVSESAIHYAFYVHDNGTGIALEHQGNIFDPFSVLVKKDKFGVAGNGIGLTTVKKVIENSVDFIKVKSEPKKRPIPIYH